MKDYDSNIIRNIAVLSHDGAGKTALVELMPLDAVRTTSIFWTLNRKRSLVMSRFSLVWHHVNGMVTN